MEIRPIRNEEDYERACERIGEIFNSEAGTPEKDEEDILAALVFDWQDQNPVLPHGDPLIALEFKLNELCLSPSDVLSRVGAKDFDELTASLAHSVKVVRSVAAAIGVRPRLIVE